MTVWLIFESLGRGSGSQALEWEPIFLHCTVVWEVTVSVGPAGEPELQGAFRKDRLWGLF